MVVVVASANTQFTSWHQIYSRCWLEFIKEATYWYVFIPLSSRHKYSSSFKTARHTHWHRLRVYRKDIVIFQLLVSIGGPLLFSSISLPPEKLKLSILSTGSIHEPCFWQRHVQSWPRGINHLILPTITSIWQELLLWTYQKSGPGMIAEGRVGMHQGRLPMGLLRSEYVYIIHGLAAVLRRP